MDDQTQGVTLDPEEELAGLLDQGQSENSPSDEQEEEIQPEGQETENDGDSQEENLTEKGTKVAKEPQSQYYQNLKNELRDMKAILSDPRLLKQVLNQMEGGNQKTNAEVKDDAKTLGKATADDIRAFMDENGAVDVLGLIEYLDKRYDSRITELSSGIARNVTREDNTAREIANTYYNQLAEARRSYPELNPESDQFDPDFEALVGYTFKEMGGEKGSATLRQALDRVIKVTGKYKEQGKKEAQTIVKKKAAGSIPQERYSGKSATGSDPDDIDPEDMLNQRLFGAR